MQKFISLIFIAFFRIFIFPCLSEKCTFGRHESFRHWNILSSTFLAVIGFCICLNANAMESTAFVTEFVTNYDNQAFDAQVTLVKSHRDSIPSAVDMLIADAHKEGISFEEKMRFLNIASALAYMSNYWHGDEMSLKKVEPIIDEELKKEQIRLAVLMKWKKEERFIGNFVMKKHRIEMEAQNLPMVLYPHWLHRIMFECKVCHGAIFRMKRWDNHLSQEEIEKGKQCGVCHDGTFAFSAKDDKSCKRCHIVGLPEARHLHDPGMVKQEKLKQAAQSVGAVWRPENLPDGKLPLDKFRFIDWLTLKEKKVFSPVVSLNKDYKDQSRNNLIFFESRSDFVNDVIFDHKVHSDWIDCTSCHPAIFLDKLGGNQMKMLDLSRGKYCGHCHGKVSFPLADCLRCHKKSVGKGSVLGSKYEHVLRRTKDAGIK